jgi:hypothetical protein
MKKKRARNNGIISSKFILIFRISIGIFRVKYVHTKAIMPVFNKGIFLIVFIDLNLSKNGREYKAVMLPMIESLRYKALGRFDKQTVIPRIENNIVVFNFEFITCFSCVLFVK